MSQVRPHSDVLKDSTMQSEDVTQLTEEKEETSSTQKLEKESQFGKPYFSKVMKLPDSNAVDMRNEQYKSATYRWNFIREPTAATTISHETEPALTHPIKGSTDIAKEMTLTPFSIELSTQSGKRFSSGDGEVIDIEMREKQFKEELCKQNLASIVSNKAESSLDATRGTDNSGIVSKNVMITVKNPNESATKAGVRDEIRENYIPHYASKTHFKIPTSKTSDDKKAHQIKKIDTFLKAPHAVKVVNLAQNSTTVLESAETADLSSENCDRRFPRKQLSVLEIKQRDDQASLKIDKLKIQKIKIEDEKYTSPMDDVSKVNVVDSEEIIARARSKEKTDTYNYPGQSSKPVSILISAACKPHWPGTKTDVEYNTDFYSSTLHEVVDTTTTDKLGMNLSTVGSSMEDPTSKRARRAMLNYISKLSSLYDSSCRIIDLLDCKTFGRRHNRSNINSLYLKMRDGLETVRNFENIFHKRFTELPNPSFFCNVNNSQLTNLDGMQKVISKVCELVVEFLNLKSKNSSEFTIKPDIRDEILKIDSGIKDSVEKNPVENPTLWTTEVSKRRRQKKSCTITKAPDTITKADDVNVTQATTLNKNIKFPIISEIPSSISSVVLDHQNDAKSPSSTTNVVETPMTLPVIVETYTISDMDFDSIASPEVLDANFKGEWICETPLSNSSISPITKPNLLEDCCEKVPTQIQELSSENSDTTVTHNQTNVLGTNQRNDQASLTLGKLKNRKRKIEDEKYACPMDDVTKSNVVDSQESIARAQSDEENENHSNPEPSSRPDSSLLGATCEPNSAMIETDVEYDTDFYSSEVPDRATTDELSLNVSTISSFMEQPAWKKARKAVQNYSSKMNSLCNYGYTIIDILNCKTFELRCNRNKINSLYLKIQSGLETATKLEEVFHQRFIELPCPGLFWDVHESQLRNIDKMVKMISSTCDVTFEFLNSKSKNSTESATEADARDKIRKIDSDFILYSDETTDDEILTSKSTEDMTGRRIKKSSTFTKHMDFNSAAMPEVLNETHRDEWISETPSSIVTISTITKPNLPEDCGKKMSTQLVDLSSENCGITTIHEQPNFLEIKQRSDQALKKKGKFRNRKKNCTNRIEDEKCSIDNTSTFKDIDTEKNVPVVLADEIYNTPGPSWRPDSPLIGATCESDSRMVESDIEYNTVYNSYAFAELSDAATGDKLGMNLSEIGSCMETPAWKKAKSALQNYYSKINSLHKLSSTVVDLLDCEPCEQRSSREGIITLYLNIKSNLETASELEKIYHQRFTELPYANLFSGIHHFQLMGIMNMIKVIHKASVMVVEFLSMQAQSDQVSST